MSDIVKASVAKMRPTQRPAPVHKEPPKVRRVIIGQDTRVKYPQIYLSVYVHGTEHEQRRFAEMFVRGGCYKADRPDKADLVVFAGSADVDPVLYNEPKHIMTQTPNKEEDDAALKMFRHCKRKGIPMLGVCKGAQILHVAMGGKLYQHINNHCGDHSIRDARTGEIIEVVSSNHHQSVIPQEGMQVLAVADLSTNKWRNPLVDDGKTGIDVEAFFYENPGIIGIQGHPEYRGYDYYAAWVLNLIDDLINSNPKFELADGGLRRLMKEKDKI